MAEEVRIKRANVILRVHPDAVQSYLNQGYNIVDEQGNVLKEGLPVTNEQFKKEYFRLKQENEQLKEELAALKSQKVASRKKKDE